MARLDHLPALLNPGLQIFFQPLQFKLEPSDLLVKFLHGRLLLPALPSRGTLQQLLLPSADLHGMHLVISGQLRHGLLATNGRQGNPGLGLRRQSPTLRCHLSEPFSAPNPPDNLNF
jgi:hypothetical protein